MIEDAPRHTDILIVGAGPVGLTLARALAESPWQVTLVDSQAPGAWRNDPRALALSHGSRQLLERMRAWDSTAATAIEEIHVGQQRGFGQTTLRAADYAIEALGYVMRYGKLVDALAAELPVAQWLAPAHIENLQPEGERIEVTLEHTGRRQRLSAGLVVHAEGTSTGDPQVRVAPYGQHAIVAEVEVAGGTDPFRPHRAWEHFTPDGPLALLPHGDGYAIVFTLPPDKAERVLELDDTGFLAALAAQFGDRLSFVATGPRAAFPLALRVRASLVQPRQVWIGNAAQTLHPVSGQGFNLGLRDAWELSEILHAQNDPGDPRALARYARGRRLDRCGSMAFTDGIVTLFSNDLAPLRAARGLGLFALDLCPPLRHFVAKRMIWGARAWP